MNTPELNAVFAPGTRVVKRYDRGVVGVVVGPARRVGGETWVPVAFGPQVEQVLVDDLESFQGRDDVPGLLQAGAFGSHRDLIRCLTVSKLRDPLRDAIYSLESSRTEFHPYQFKPLIKFLYSERRKLLIADEVGLGKTIEAAFIIQELKARHDIGRILVVCPAALRWKWQTELYRRFREDFAIVDAAGFRRVAMTPTQDPERALNRCQVIVSLQSIRSDKIIEDLQSRPAPFDLLIVDEAHHCRNSETKQHRVVRILTELTEAAVYLTATPLHTGNENLFNLLRLLLPEEFDRLDVFEQRLRLNRYIVEAEQMIRKRTREAFEQSKARLETLAGLPDQTHFRRNPLYRRVVERLGTLQSDDYAGVVATQEDLSQLNLFSHVLTRSKKRDARSEQVQRVPNVVRAEMSEMEQAAYDTISQYCFARFQQVVGDFGAVFALINLQRQMASSIHATIDYYAGLLEGHESDPDNGIEEVTTDLDNGRTGDDADELPTTTRRLLDDPVFGSMIDELGAMLRGSHDSKFDELCKLLNHPEHNKLIIFAYYKRSLRYLEQRLTEMGIRCERIDGDVPSNPMDPDNDERQKRITKFRDDETIQVLLSSSVGGEGLDFQFCHTMVNWDLPWNPMEVEQRIGRLDRVGQQSEKILIFNFSIPGTIEDEILNRLYRRVGLFEGAIGPLEPILGHEVRGLREQLFNPRLTPVEREQMIENRAIALEFQLQNERRLEEEAGGLIGMDAMFQEKLNRVRQLGRYVTPSQVRVFLEDFLARQFPACQPSPIPQRPGYVQYQVTGELIDFVRQHLARDDPSLVRYLERTRPGQVVATFDPEIANHDGKVEFINPLHPLVVAAGRFYGRAEQQPHAVAAVEVRTDEVPLGDYFYLWASVNEKSLRGGRFLWAECVSVDGRTRLEADTAEQLLHQLVVQGEEWRDFDVPETELTMRLYQRSEENIAERVMARRREAAEENAALVEARLASLESSYRARRAERQRNLDIQIERGNTRVIPLFEAQLNKTDHEYKQRREEIEAQREVAVTFQIEGAGYASVMPSDEHGEVRT